VKATTPIRLRAFRAARFVYHDLVTRERVVDHLVAAGGDRAEVEQALEAGLRFAHLLPAPRRGQLEAELHALNERIATRHEQLQRTSEAYLLGRTAGRGRLLPAVALAAVTQRAVDRGMGSDDALRSLHPHFEAGLRAGAMEITDAAA
jgi:hypothetical protein